MLVTINTDASFNHKHKVGTYAFWAVCNDWRIQKCGVLRDLAERPEDAEMKCIINAVHTVMGQAGRKPTRLIINTDCMNAIHVLSGDGGMISKYRLARFKPLRQKFNKIIGGIKVEFRHVKAHNDTDTARTWVNDWCDQRAKEMMNKKLAEINKGLVEQTSSPGEQG